MNNQLRWKKDAARCCAEFGAEDGIDPRYLVATQVHKKSSRKELQLCKEATRIISLVLTGETGQPLLRDLQVLSVQPEHDGQSVCVSVGHYAKDSQVSDTEGIGSLETRTRIIAYCFGTRTTQKTHADSKFSLCRCAWQRS